MKENLSLQEFNSLRKQVKDVYPPDVPTVVIPAGTCGRASGALNLVRAAEHEILRRRLQETVRLKVTGCHGFCQMEPSVLISPEGTFYPKVKPADIPTIIEALLAGRPAAELLYHDSPDGAGIEKQNDIPFYRGQKRLLLSRNENIDPLDLYDYLRADGYASFVSLVSRGDPRAVIEAVKTAGLKGRGGAGFPTGTKWELLAARKNGSDKYIVCNADEGDPGAYMDRSLLEGNPHSIIEGMLIGAFATGADRGVVYVRTEYPLAIRHLDNAVRQARETGLLGKNILGSGMNFDISMVKGAGAFVCGEETALMRSIEGRMGEPRQRPPFPVQSGINGKPTLINNVETWANIPVIFEMGPKAYAAIGIANTGTKIFSLVGKIKNTGLVEVPMGAPIRDIVYEIGGGASGAAAIKAVQTGGPSGGCIPARLFDLPIGYESLSRAGSIMGSGGMIVMDENTCMIDIARYFMNFLKGESCGKCFSCRKGTQRMYELLDDISAGKATPGHLDLLEELALVLKDVAMCGLGQTASNPVLSTLKHFRDEYIEHIDNKRCPAGVCKGLISFTINERCTGCGVCRKACPEEAITGEKKKPHVIDLERCSRCGSCRSVCKFDAIDVR
ncbi:MAG TPA: NADH-ubiquinone oxidoreductase-F iron-sulfur binding region domain-containing protein [Syntrophales bacterium]|nr:NADH-ubiquinone oxidoreductase-F iron-sulfur binding region domain-containing protein [Syntrophales bacterium]HOX94068.1 NADH-ubiquinone oxidoreductase-F iron-sulfur binding region domain-containing protein [Syntrophales bacterium]HPI58547.1 NADH-ubiquinone oxidoreductase-F iron-sulfur binding region domain-containing protein [Syntrophales bacterium]HPN24304.1 NADH-ubiquinone oxidoreductase-F iron-sulfur binding region domain-containing protein [Syntrophales bacterium]HQM28656.1 NADH-ubiquin